MEELTKNKTVTSGDLASALHSGNADVLSTPMVLAWMEETASELADHFLSDDKITVGAHVTLDHLAPAWIGDDVKINAKLTEKNGKKFVFHIEMYLGDKVLARADHVRVAVDRKKFKK